MENELQTLKIENNYLRKHNEYNINEHNLFYIKRVTTTIEGKKAICYKFGGAKDDSRFNSYKTGNTDLEILFYVPLVVDSKMYESCMKSLYKMHPLKKGNEIYCWTNINDLIHDLILCRMITSDHVCHCVHCKKKLSIDEVPTHTCINNLINRQKIYDKNNQMVEDDYNKNKNINYSHHSTRSSNKFDSYNTKIKKNTKKSTGSKYEHKKSLKKYSRSRKYNYKKSSKYKRNSKSLRTRDRKLNHRNFSKKYKRNDKSIKKISKKRSTRVRRSTYRSRSSLNLKYIRKPNHKRSPQDPKKNYRINPKKKYNKYYDD